jgi:hypothetical protein
MSWFDQDLICVACIEEEEAHPDFEKAKAAENAAVAAGNLNFEGIGWPGKIK